MERQPITRSMEVATLGAIERIARAVARDCTGQRQQDAIAHLKRIEARKRSTADLEAEIARLQEIQKRNPPTSNESQLASDLLQPLFDEMVRRQQAGEL